MFHSHKLSENFPNRHKENHRGGLNILSGYTWFLLRETTVMRRIVLLYLFSLINFNIFRLFGIQHQKKHKKREKAGEKENKMIVVKQHPYLMNRNNKRTLIRFSEITFKSHIYDVTFLQ